MSAAAGRMPIAGEPQEPLEREDLARPVDDERGDEDDAGELGELAGLHALAAEDDPAAGAVDDAADAGHEDDDEAGEGEPRERHGGLAEPGVVDAREHVHGADAEDDPHDLAAEEVEAAAVLEVGLGRRGAVGHDEAVDDEQEGDQHERAAFGDARARGPSPPASRAGRRRAARAARADVRGARSGASADERRSLDRRSEERRSRGRRLAGAGPALRGPAVGARPRAARSVLDPVEVVEIGVFGPASGRPHVASAPCFSSLTSLRKCSPRCS